MRPRGGVADYAQPRFVLRVLPAWDLVVALEIAFAEKQLRHICESEAAARRALGAEVAEKLKARLADLRAASCVKELVAGRPRKVASRRLNHLVVSLSDGCRLVICANHNLVPKLDNGSVDWSKVNRVKVVDIENDHA
jgi:proteic killer suppression protein